MVTRPADTRQVPRPGDVAIVAKLFGEAVERPMLTIDDGPVMAMAGIAGTAFWRATVSLDAGLHRVTVASGADRDTIKLLVRAEDDIPRRGLPVTPGHDIHAIGAWPEHGLEGTRLGPNKNGVRW